MSSLGAQLSAVNVSDVPYGLVARNSVRIGLSLRGSIHAKTGPR